MNATVPTRLRTLLRGDPVAIAAQLDADPQSLPFFLAVTVLGSAVYASTLGWWRAPEQAAWAAIKFPLVMLLTAIGNAGLNGVLAQLLGTGLTFGRTCSAILLSFAIAATILAAFSPLILFLLLNVPTLGTSDSAYAVVLVSHVAAIALAGVVANYRLLRLIQHLCGSLGIARRTLLAWLAGNLLLGSQVAWVLRPFVGTPGAPVTFLRNDAVRGNFFEAIADSMRRLIVE